MTPPLLLNLKTSPTAAFPSQGARDELVSAMDCHDDMTRFGGAGLLRNACGWQSTCAVTPARAEHAEQCRRRAGRGESPYLVTAFSWWESGDRVVARRAAAARVMTSPAGSPRRTSHRPSAPVGRTGAPPTVRMRPRPIPLMSRDSRFQPARAGPPDTGSRAAAHADERAVEQPNIAGRSLFSK